MSLVKTVHYVLVTTIQSKSKFNIKVKDKVWVIFSVLNFHMYPQVSEGSPHERLLTKLWYDYCLTLSSYLLSRGFLSPQDELEYGTYL